VLDELFYEGIIQKESLMRMLSVEKDRVLVPIPLHENKVRKRGYNHAAILGKELSKKLHISFFDCLIRGKETTVQHGLSKQQRKENIHNAFILPKQKNITNMVIFLVDDIVTSGVTFMEAANVMKRSGAKAVYGIALAGEK
jgi:ComF family protein